MKITLSRELAIFFNKVLDDLVPPILRDVLIIWWPVYKLVFGSKAADFMRFKEQAALCSNEDMQQIYSQLADSHVNRRTDINNRSMRYIINEIEAGQDVLDVACGRGYLTEELTRSFCVNVVGVDFALNEEMKASVNPKYISGSVERIPFSDKSFDVVVCAHTLEHLLDIRKGVEEIRRVCRKKLIVVLPRQRPSRFTFDLHVHFFPYKYNVELLFYGAEGRVLNVGGDWVYIEEYL